MTDYETSSIYVSLRLENSGSSVGKIWTQFKARRQILRNSLMGMGPALDSATCAGFVDRQTTTRTAKRHKGVANVDSQSSTGGAGVISARHGRSIREARPGGRSHGVRRTLHTWITRPRRPEERKPARDGYNHGFPCKLAHEDFHRGAFFVRLDCIGRDHPDWLARSPAIPGTANTGPCPPLIEAAARTGDAGGARACFPGRRDACRRAHRAHYSGCWAWKIWSDRAQLLALRPSWRRSNRQMTSVRSPGSMLAMNCVAADRMK